LRGEPFDKLRAVRPSNGIEVRVNNPIPFPGEGRGEGESSRSSRISKREPG